MWFLAVPVLVLALVLLALSWGALRGDASRTAALARLAVTLAGGLAVTLALAVVSRLGQFTGPTQAMWLAAAANAAALGWAGMALRAKPKRMADCPGATEPP